MTIGNIATIARDLSDSDSTSYTNANLLIYLNAAYENVVGKLIQSDGRWQFDDTSYSTFPIGTLTLVDNQTDYSFDTTFLNILRVAVLYASDSVYHDVYPVDKRDFSSPLETEFQTKGTPLYYDKDGKSILLYPAPDTTKVTAAAGLKVWFQRTASVWTSSDLTTGTATPGFASPFHEILAYMTAIPYCLKYKQNRVPALEAKVQTIMNDLINFYSKREKDDMPRISMGGVSHI